MFVLSFKAPPYLQFKKLAFFLYLIKLRDKQFPKGQGKSMSIKVKVYKNEKI
jgi:hypothetical protein